MKPDLDAIRKKWRERNIVDGNDVPTLLAYIDELEAAWRNERATFASCNRARKHCELECEDLRKRVAELDVLPPTNAEHEAIVDGMLAKAREGVTKRPIGTYSPGETEWASRIAHAEARFVEEYDMRKAAERQVEELRAEIDILRHRDVQLKRAHGALTDAGCVVPLEFARSIEPAIKELVRERDELRSRIVTLEAMR